MFWIKLTTIIKIKEVIRATAAPNLMVNSGVASEKINMAMINVL